MRFDYALIISRLPDVFNALVVTVGIWIVSLIGASLLGFVVAVARRYGPRWLNWLLGAYVEIFRGTPFLIQLFLLYFGGPYAGLSLDAIPAGIVALSIYGARLFQRDFPRRLRGGSARPCRGGGMRRAFRADRSSDASCCPR